MAGSVSLTAYVKAPEALSTRLPCAPESAEPSVPLVEPKLTAVTVLVSPASGSVSLVSTLPVAAVPPVL